MLDYPLNYRSDPIYRVSARVPYRCIQDLPNLCVSPDHMCGDNPLFNDIWVGPGPLVIKTRSTVTRA